MRDAANLQRDDTPPDAVGGHKSSPDGETGEIGLAPRRADASSAWRYLCYVWRTDRLARAEMILLVSWLLLLGALIAR